MGVHGYTMPEWPRSHTHRLSDWERDYDSNSWLNDIKRLPQFHLQTLLSNVLAASIKEVIRITINK